MKRFWRDVTVTRDDPATGFGLALDGRPLRTPARLPCVVPTRAMAEAMAAEWLAQPEGAEIDPVSMPLTRAANVTIDRVAAVRGDVVRGLAAFGETDLLCYRAPQPPALAMRQAEAWDPVLDWAAESFGARLVLAEGVMPAAQDPAALARLAAAVDAHDAWALTALNELVTLSGSLLLGLAVSRGRLDAEVGWRLSRIDEDWNAAQWGEDAEAAAIAALKERDFHRAARLLVLLRAG